MLLYSTGGFRGVPKSKKLARVDNFFENLKYFFKNYRQKIQNFRRLGGLLLSSPPWSGHPWLFRFDFTVLESCFKCFKSSLKSCCTCWLFRRWIIQYSNRTFSLWTDCIKVHIFQFTFFLSRLSFLRFLLIYFPFDIFPSIRLSFH